MQRAEARGRGRAKGASDNPKRIRCKIAMELCNAMPTVLRNGAYRYFFYASDRGEPPHIHVERENKVAKFWLNPPRLEQSGGFSRAEISRIQRMVGDHREEFQEAWDEFFGD